MCIPACLGPACLPTCWLDVAKRSSDPPAAVRHWRARKSSGTGSCEDCRNVLWEPGPRGQYSGKFEKPGVQDEGVATWLNVVLTPDPPPAAVHQAKFRDGTVWDLYKGPAGTGACTGQYSGKIRFIEKPWVRRVQDEGGRHVAKRSSNPQQRFAMGELVKVLGRDRVGIVAGYCG